MWWTRGRQMARVTAENGGVCGALSTASLRQEGPPHRSLMGASISTLQNSVRSSFLFIHSLLHALHLRQCLGA